MTVTMKNQAVRETDVLPRILVIAPQPFYQDRGTPIAVLHAIRAMVQSGFWVDVATFGGGVDPDESGIRIFRAESQWSSPNLPIGLSWRKIAQHVALYRLAGNLLRQNHYDAIHAIEESVFAARLLTRQSGTPVVYDMHSWLSDELSQLPLLNHWPARQIIRAIERKAVSKCSKIFCSAGLGSTAQRLKGSPDVTEWFFPVQRRPLHATARATVRSTHGIDANCELIVYTGNLATNQNIDLFVEAIALLGGRRANAQFAIVGASDADAKQLRQDLDSSLQSRVHIFERLPRKDALDITASADVTVSLRVRGLNAPLKLFDYIGAGIPVVATDIPAHRVVLGSAAEY